MMHKVKIIIVDRNKTRRENIWKSVQRFNILPKHKSCFRDIWDENNKTQIRNDARFSPNLFLLHVNDQIHKNDPHYEYLKHINKELPNALIVLYSGGEYGICIEQRTKTYLKIKEAKTWEFNVSNADQFCIIGRPIDSAADLRIVPALEEYTAGRNREEFFNILLCDQEAYVVTESLGQLRMKLLEPFVALDILMQGYLAIKNPDAFAQKVGTNWQIDVNSPGFIKAQTEIENTPCLWFRECWSDMETIFYTVDGLLGDLKEEQKESDDMVSSIEDLRELISPKTGSVLIQVCSAIEECRKNCVPGDVDQCSHTNTDGICERCLQMGGGILFMDGKIKQAHEDYLLATRWFEKKKLVHEFLEFRAFVSHTLYQHRFWLGDLTDQNRNRVRLFDPYEWPLLKRKIEDMFDLGRSLFGLRCDEVFIDCRARIDRIIGKIEDFKAVLATGRSTSFQQQESFVKACDQLYQELSDIPDLLHKAETGFSPSEINKALAGITPGLIRNQVEVLIMDDIAPLLLSFDSSYDNKQIIFKNGTEYWQCRSDLDGLMFRYKICKLFYSFGDAEDKWEKQVRSVIEVFDKLAGAFRLPLSLARRQEVVDSCLEEQKVSSVENLISRFPKW